MADYILRDVDDELWKRVRLKVLKDGHASIRGLIIKLLEAWVRGKVDVAP